MNIEALRTFLAVVETGNLNKAAERLNVTQSTVTARLDVLDAALGQPLLIRSRRGAQLTRAGFEFRRHAEQIAQSWEQARRRISLPRGVSSLFSFACEVDLWESLGEAWMAQAKATTPGLACESWPGTHGEIEGWLASGITDVALLSDPVKGPGLGSEALGRERLVQVATKPQSAQRWRSDYVYVDLGPEFRRLHSAAWPSDETAPLSFGCSRWALDHLLREGGSAYLPWRLTKRLVSEGRLFVVEGAPEFSRALFLAWREISLGGHPWIRDVGLWAPFIDSTSSKPADKD